MAAKVIVPGDGNLRTELMFYKPTRRSMDHDNLLARMKAGLDGVADALAIDDRRFNPLIIRVADEIGGYVLMRIFDKEL